MSRLANPNFFERNTQLIFVGSRWLISPLEAMYGLLAFIFCKDLNATPLQITLLISSKPIVALLSFYGNLIIKGQPTRLKTLILWSNLLAFLPCFLFPFVDNVWFYLASFALFMMSLRAMIPAWSEILKINCQPEARGKIFSQASTANYLTNIGIPVLISPWIDYYPHSWKWIFFILAAIQSLNVLLILFIKIKSYAVERDNYLAYHMNSLNSMLWGPWKNCWTLMKQRWDFRSFQIAFMLGGGGLMLMHPVLPVFFKEALQLSYTQLTLATCLCKGISFALASPIWAKGFNRMPIHLFNFFVNLCAAIFAICITFSESQLFWIYPAFLFYGMMQAGSELSWNLSGPIFSQDKDSTLFTGVNIAMVGLRGCIAPFLGELLFLNFNASFVFMAGGSFCLCGALYSFWINAVYKKRAESAEVNAFGDLPVS
jgi:Major Facilitator Superfamily